MGLTSKYSTASGRLADLFSKLRDGQAPPQFTQQVLKDWGFTSSTDRAAIPLLKELGFLSPDGKPTTRYHEYRDHSKSRAVMAAALHEAYGDLFLIKEHPTDGDREAIHGKFRSFHNVSDAVATWMTRTFYTLLSLADLRADNGGANGAPASMPAASPVEPDAPEPADTSRSSEGARDRHRMAGLHYNIQIHLPASKDIEVYNAIFKSLKEHLLEK